MGAPPKPNPGYALAVTPPPAKVPGPVSRVGGQSWYSHPHSALQGGLHGDRVGGRPVRGAPEASDLGLVPGLACAQLLGEPHDCLQPSQTTPRRRRGGTKD